MIEKLINHIDELDNFQWIYNRRKYIIERFLGNDMYKVLLLNKQIQFYGSTKTNPMIFSRLSKTKLLMLENFGLKIIFTDEHEGAE